MSVPSTRLDQLLVARGLSESREKAQRLIMAGQVRVNGQVASKPGHSYAADAEIAVAQLERYVSRGGGKLEAALVHFAVNVTGLVAMDIGASTGGFTDCLLQHGARKVYAVDVGHGQLHWKLRNDPRVVALEGVNARYLDPAAFQESPDMAAVDVSFISLTLVLPAVTQVLATGGRMITLIKPQFEAGREQVGKGGVVRETAVHEQVLSSVRAFGESRCPLEWKGHIASPLQGPAGNVEFLAYWIKR